MVSLFCFRLDFFCVNWKINCETGTGNINCATGKKNLEFFECSCWLLHETKRCHLFWFCSCVCFKQDTPFHWRGTTCVNFCGPNFGLEILNFLEIAFIFFWKKNIEMKIFSSIMKFCQLEIALLCFQEKKKMIKKYCPLWKFVSIDCLLLCYFTLIILSLQYFIHRKTSVCIVCEMFPENRTAVFYMLNSNSNLLSNWNLLWHCEGLCNVSSREKKFGT